jgi:Asp-tRNA(Asn)/Glu-tRNA(Gln) amidotransferase A subunit family amidase
MTRTVRDAAVILDVIAGPTKEDPRTDAASGHLPAAGYVTGLSETALEGKRFGLVGPGWRTSFLPLAPETEELYGRAIKALEAQGASVVEDPFAGTEFIQKYRERRGARSAGRDEMSVYLEGLGDGAAFHSIQEWEELTGRVFRRGGSSREGGRQPSDSARVAGRERSDRFTPSDSALSFQDWRAEIQELFRNVLNEHELDGLFFPQAGAPIPDLIEDPSRPDYNPNNHPELPSNIVNDIGLPVVTLPFGYYENGTPFVLAFIGDIWTEAELLAYAYDLEQAVPGRVPPQLSEGSPQ